MTVISSQYAANASATGRVEGWTPLRVMLEQHGDVLGDQGTSEPPPLNIGHVPNEAEQREAARRARSTTGLLVAEAFRLPREDAAVVGQVPEEDGALVFAERLGGGKRRDGLGHHSTVSQPAPGVPKSFPPASRPAAISFPRSPHPLACASVGNGTHRARDKSDIAAPRRIIWATAHQSCHLRCGWLIGKGSGWNFCKSLDASRGCGSSPRSCSRSPRCCCTTRSSTRPTTSSARDSSADLSGRVVRDPARDRQHRHRRRLLSGAQAGQRIRRPRLRRATNDRIGDDPHRSYQFDVGPHLSRRLRRRR